MAKLRRGLLEGCLGLQRGHVGLAVAGTVAASARVRASALSAGCMPGAVCPGSVGMVRVAAGSPVGGAGLSCGWQLAAKAAGLRERSG